jgi:hypothetical protein
LTPTRLIVSTLLSLLFTIEIQARPIVFADSTNVMLDYREGAMAEAQISYAPEHWMSVGLGYTDLSTDYSASHSFTYARMSVLVKRWNMEGAQANIFGWGGIGNTYIGRYVAVFTPDGDYNGHDHGGPPPDPESGVVAAINASAYNAGAQFDYETLRFYSSFKTDYVDSPLFWHRADTLQIGFAPYRHDTDSLATWFIISGRNYAGDLHESQELAFLVRLFKKRSWVEAGATTDGKIQALLMFNF